MVELARLGEVTGIELSPTSVAVARARNVGEVVEGSVEELPFEDDSFDFAVCLDVIEHLDDDLQTLRELRRVVRPGGRLLVTVPAYPSLWSSHDVVNHHRRRYTRAEPAGRRPRERMGGHAHDPLQRAAAAGGDGLPLVGTPQPPAARASARPTSSAPRRG